MSEDARVLELIEELRSFTDPAMRDERVAELVVELEAKAPLRRDGVSAGLLAGTLPLLHRVGPKSVDAFLDEIAKGGGVGGGTLRPGEGSAARQILLAALGEGRCVYFWLGHCAYAHPDPELLWIWSAEAERVGPAGMAAPWDSAGLCTEATLGRNLDAAGATERVKKYSLPIQGDHVPPHRRYLAEVLERSFEHPDDYWNGGTPTAWYPGWEMAPPRLDNGGTMAAPPHHTFEVRRQGEVSLVEKLLGVVASANVLARNRAATKALEHQVKTHAVWAEGRRVHRVDTGRGMKVLRTASNLVRTYLERSV